MTTKMTRAEFYERYGNVELTFIGYYKYTFTYAAVLPDGKRLNVGCGGNPDDIYRHEVSVGVSETLRQLQPFQGVVFEEGIEVESFYDY